LKSDESALWQSFLNGDKESFNNIYTKYYSSLYEYAIRKLRDEDLVRDAIQNLFVKLWLNKKNLSSIGHIKYYLFASLKNQILNLYIQQSNQNKYLRELSNAESFTLEFDSTDYLEQKELNKIQIENIQKALNSLTDKQKEVIYLKYFEELEYDQIAELMDISVKGVYKLNYRALEALREILDISKKDLFVLLLMIKTMMFIR
jgi:RNA polymerase sigma factor, sigma-70 family